MSKFQRAQDLIRLIEIQQRGASAGYEFWRMLNKELSVRSRVEGQALREQALNLYPPKYLKRPLDVMRWYMTELMKYESQVTSRFPELKIHEQEAVLGVLKHLDEDAKRYLLLHQTTSGLDAMLRGLQFYDEQLRVLSFQKEHQHGGYLNAFGAGKGDNPKGKKGDKEKKGKGKGEGKDKKGKGKDGKDKPKGKDRGGGAASSSAPRAKSKAKKTDVCHNCGGKGHWARDCPVKQASAVSHHEGSGATTGGAAGSSGNDAGNAALAAKAAPKTPSSQPTTKGNAEKGAGKGVRTFLEGAYFAMPSLALPFVQPGDKIYWLLDSGSSYHVVSKQTLETGHVKILSKRKMPKTVCQTATGDLVEVGSDTHATIEVNFLTTRPLEKHGDVLSTFACTCRLEAIVSDQIRHNLINLNLLCWKGWKPTLYEGLLTAEQKGITLYPHLYGDCTWLESVEPEHPSAMLASVSSHVGRSVGRSVDFQSPEKPDFSQHEQEFLHEGHGFSRHEHGFSREPLLHEPLSVIGGSAVGQLPCGSAEVQLVGQLPARVVELLQSGAVGEPRQDHRLCQDVSGTFSAASPATSSGPGPAQKSARCISSESLHGMSSESLLGMSSESLLGMSVGRSVGRSGGCAGVGVAVSQCAENPVPHETVWPELPPDRLGHHCSDAPGQQVEAGTANSGGIHLRPAIEYDSHGGRVAHGSRIDASLLSPLSGARGGMVHNAPAGPHTARVAEVLPRMWQGRNTRSLGHRCSQQGDQQLEASGMPSVGHHAGQVYRQPEVGNGLAGLPAQLHGGTGPCSQRTSPTGRVVSFFEPGQVRGSDPQRQRRRGSDGGVIVGGTFGFSGASLDEGWRDMDGATAAAPGAESWRYMDKATTTPFRAATMEHPKKKPRRRTIGRTSGRPWPDTYGVALRSSALLHNARPLDPLTPRSTSPPQVVSSSDSDDQWGVWRAAGARHQDASGSQRPKTPPKASGVLGSRAKGSEAMGRPTSEPPLPPPRPASAPLPPPTEAPGVHYAWTAATYPSGGAIYSSPSGESYFTRERMGLVGAQERQLWEEARLRTAAASRSVRPRRAFHNLPRLQR